MQNQSAFGSVSQWYNPLNVVQTVKLLVREGKPGQKAEWAEFVFPPGETVAIPSYFDSGIHQLDRAGNVVGGEAPLLQKVGSKRKVDPAIDFRIAEAKEKQADMHAAIVARAGEVLLESEAAKAKQAKK